MFSLITESLIKYGSNTNHQDIKGISPLMLAAYKGQDDNVEILIKHKTNLNIKDTLGSNNKLN